MNPLFSTCPQCQQNTPVPTEGLQEKLESDEVIAVIGVRCRHRWGASDDEKVTWRKAFATEDKFLKAVYSSQAAAPPRRNTKPPKQRKESDPPKRTHERTEFKGGRAKY